MKSILFILFMSSFQAFAFYEPSSNVLPLRDRFKVTTVHEEAVSQKAQKFIAYLSLASQSVFYEMKEPALADLAAAETEARHLLKESTSLMKIPGLPLSKIGADDSDVYVPVWTADGISEDLRSEKRFFKTRTTIENAKLVIVTLSLSMKGVLVHLEKARGFVKQNKFPEALKSLSAIRNDVLVSESDVTDPLLTVWAKVSLADEFLNLKDYSNARFTLKQVKKDLARLEKEKVLKKDSSEVKILESDIRSLEDMLSEKSPTITEKGKANLETWKLKIKNWM